MNEKMNFGEIRRDISDNLKAKNLNKEREGTWGVYDSSIDSFGFSFLSCLPDSYSNEIYDKEIDFEEYGEPFRKYILETLAKSKGDRHTAIEFGGPGSALFTSFSNKDLYRTVGVCLDDIRGSSEKGRDEEYGHSVIIGDLFDTKNEEMYKQIREKIGAVKTDLILSRMMGPLDDIAKNPIIMDRVIRKWYEMLNENGLIFVQFDYYRRFIRVDGKSTPKRINREHKSEIEDDVEEWIKKIKTKFPNEIDIQIGEGVLRLHKKEGSPETLPALKELGS